MDSDLLFYFVVILLVLKIFSIIFVVVFPQSIFFSDITKAVLINLVNQDRVSLGLEPLKESEKLDKGAYLKAQDMIEKDYFSHQSPEGISPWHWFGKIGYGYKYAGENLAIGFLDSEEIYNAWSNSISHKDNLLNPKYQEVGTAVLKGDFQGNETTIVVQLFGAPQIVPAKESKEGLKAAENTIEEKQNESQDLILEESKVEENDELQEKQEVLSQSEEIYSAPINLPKKENAGNKFLEFLSYGYQNLLEIMSYVLLFLVVVSLLINILIYFEIQRKDLILKTFILIIILSFSSFFSKETLIRIIPHNFSI